MCTADPYSEQTAGDTQQSEASKNPVLLHSPPSSISGNPVSSSTRRTARPADPIADALPPEDTSSYPRSNRSCRSPHVAMLSCHTL